MREIWTADCETDPFRKGRVPAPFIWGTYCLERDEYEQTETFDQFLDFHLGHGREIIVYAHNGGKFDWHFGLHRLEEFEPLMLINGRLAKFKIGNVEFRDSWNILPVPLREMKKDEFDYTILEKAVRDKPKNRDKIKSYLKSDCVYLAEYVQEFINKYGLNLTLASSAMKYWREQSGIRPPKTDERHYELFSRFYYGGRVQCFQTGELKKAFRVVDINSAYPFAMKQDHPWGVAWEFIDALPADEMDAGRCFIELNAESTGCFPYRLENGSLGFPADGETRRYFVTGWEYLAAADTGTLGTHEIKSILRFSQKVNFTDYIDHFYAMKAQSEKETPEYVFAKLFLNSLYGKFGANPKSYQENMVVPKDCVASATMDGFAHDGDIGQWALMSKDIDEENRRYFNVAVAASITGFVRAYMWKALNACKGVIYCDTDSIAAEGLGDLELDSAKLGAWDLEAECVYGAVAGKKLYAFETTEGKWKTASKGAKLTAKQIVKVAQGEEVIYDPEAPTFSLKRGIGFVPRKINLTG